MPLKPQKTLFSFFGTEKSKSKIHETNKDCIKVTDTDNKLNEKVNSKRILSNKSGRLENSAIDYIENDSSSSDDFVPKKKRSAKRNRRQKNNFNISNSERSNAEHGSSDKTAVDSKTEEMSDHDQMEIDNENICRNEKEDPLATSPGMQLDTFFKYL